LREKIRVENLRDSNIDDLIHICSSQRLSDPAHQQGIKLKKQWLHEMLGTWGSCAKIAYYNDKPVAQILYYPEEADVTKAFKRKNVLVINCIYNPTPETQRLGIGARLLQSVVKDARERKTRLGTKPCSFVLAKVFNTGEFLPMPEFYEKMGFLPTSEASILYFPIEGKYEPTKPVREYSPLREDDNRALIFFSPICQFGYHFARMIEKGIKEIAPKIKIEVINEWEKPEELIKRKNCSLVVNARPIRTFFMDAAKFREEVRQAISQNP
jgi:GNAT superfamily N-acetyltransferase